MFSPIPKSEEMKIPVLRLVDLDLLLTFSHPFPLKACAFVSQTDDSNNVITFFICINIFKLLRQN
jgi:hypothetical protein